jgi:DNA-binding response OmpR family regulator
MEFQKASIRSILLIDDDRDDYELVMEAVKEVDPAITVYFISKCEEAVQYKGQTFDLVLLDINMPQHDGFAWLKGIREHGYSDLPIVMYTNSLSPVHISKAYEAGANLYFSKPESYSKLIKGFRKLIEMDWSNPVSITANYRHQGRYKTFQVE